MAKLRSPSGCPGTGSRLEFLKKYLIEESYEVLEAIESGTPGNCGRSWPISSYRLFLFPYRRGKKDFNFPGLVQELAEKLIRRHPHVFPSPHRPRPNPECGEVLKVWGSVKELEGKYAKRKSLLDGIPLPFRPGNEPGGCRRGPPGRL